MDMTLRATTQLGTYKDLTIFRFCLCDYLAPSRIPDNWFVRICSHGEFLSRETAVSHCTCWTMPPSLPESSQALPDRIRAILATRGLSLAEISRQSRIRFVGNSLFRIPPNFYDALRHVSFSPSIHQFFALSVLSGYRLTDWLHLFGFSFDDPARFQSSWPRYHTTELDAHVYDPSIDIAWFEEVRPVSLGAGLTPLSQWLSGRTIRSLDSLSSKFGPSFRYLKIGSRDAYAYPDLLPGSIVRVDTRITAEQLLGKEQTKYILAIEHGRGVVCSRLRIVGRGRVVLCSRQLPYAPIELKLGAEARILGIVDLEIRRLASTESPEVSRNAGRVWTPSAIRPPAPSGRIGEWVQRARIRCGLSFREASERTADIARILKQPNYFCAASALSDLEAREVFPRHVHKLISLSAVYCLSIAELAGLAGLRIEDAGQAPMPDEWQRTPPRRARREGLRPSHFLEAVESKFEEIPFFLRGALPSILGQLNLSVRDLFWAGATSRLVHPYLRDSAFLAVNRKSKTPAPSLSSPVWAQPLYVLEMRDGNRLCAACSLHDGTLVIRPCTTTSGDLLRLRNRIDVEVLGRVVAIVRRLGPEADRIA